MRFESLAASRIDTSYPLLRLQAAGPLRQYGMPDRNAAPQERAVFSFWGGGRGQILSALRESFKEYLQDRGFIYAEAPPDHVRVVFNIIDDKHPRPYRRKAQATFVVSWAEVGERPADVLRFGYPLLIRSLSNVLVLFLPGADGPETHFITPEQGHYTLRKRPTDPGFLDEFYSRLQPRDLRHLKRLYHLGGLSYGNMSVRRDAGTFWMSASGVDKANMRVVGRDIQLVKGFAPERRVMLLSVPPEITPRRVSVDAIEHYLIYREHPNVGAIVHVHAWIEGTKATEVNYPCGTIQLAHAVAGLVRESDDPARAIVGLKNHGLTITGPDLDDIFERIEGKIVPTVPMA